MPLTKEISSNFRSHEIRLAIYLGDFSSHNPTIETFGVGLRTSWLRLSFNMCERQKWTWPFDLEISKTWCAKIRHISVCFRDIHALFEITFVTISNGTCNANTCFVWHWPKVMAEFWFGGSTWQHKSNQHCQNGIWPRKWAHKIPMQSQGQPFISTVYQIRFRLW